MIIIYGKNELLYYGQYTRFMAVPAATGGAGGSAGWVFAGGLRFQMHRSKTHPTRTVGVVHRFAVFLVSTRILI